MFLVQKIKSKNGFGLSSRTTVYYNTETKVITIQVIMIVPINENFNGFELFRTFKNHKIIINDLEFKLSTFIRLTYSINTLFKDIIDIENKSNIQEFEEFAKNLKYKTNDD